MSANSKVTAVEELDWSADALERLSELRGARDIIDWLIEQSVIECRKKVYPAISWERIADELGIARQTAWERYRLSE